MLRDQIMLSFIIVHKSTFWGNAEVTFSHIHYGFTKRKIVHKFHKNLLQSQEYSELRFDVWF